MGPGTGVLTKYLFGLGNNINLIEIDKGSCDYLAGQFPEKSEFIHKGDFLKDDITPFLVAPAAVIGNFPYNISSQIFFRILENKQVIDQVVCMIQKEVADRIRAPHGSVPRVSPLSAQGFELRVTSASSVVPWSCRQPTPREKCGLGGRATSGTGPGRGHGIGHCR